MGISVVTKDGLRQPVQLQMAIDLQKRGEMMHGAALDNPIMCLAT